MSYDDRVYHGVQIEPDDEFPDAALATITVEVPKSGGHRPLYQLYACDEFGDHFAWGYDGDGPHRAAAALLSDALALADPGTVGMAIGATALPWVLLRDDFVFDFLENACDEWRLTRPTILRWSRTWYFQRGLTELPAELKHLPELQADPEIYRPMNRT